MEDTPLEGLTEADPLLSVAEAAQHLGITTRSIYKLIHHPVDPLPVVRRKPYLIRRSDLNHRRVKRKTV